MLQVVKEVSITHLYLDILECCVAISHDLGEQLQHISNREQQGLLLKRRERERERERGDQSSSKTFFIKSIIIYLIIGRCEFFHSLAQYTHCNILQVT